MSATKIVFLYPGQGGYSSDLIGQVAAGSPAAREAIATVTEIARAELLLDMSPLTSGGLDLPDLLDRAPGVLQMAIYAASVATALGLADAGVKPAMHIGHSLGEIAALAAGGACSVADGARIVAWRVRALSVLSARSGFMLGVNATHETAQRLLEFLGEPETAIAGVNGDSQVVISGATRPMERTAAVLAAAGLSASRLPSPYPFHSPVLEPAVASFESSLRDIVWSPPSTPVYSPIEGRWYGPGDDFAAIVAGQLVRPFDFSSAVRRAPADGARLFVECSGRQTLTGLVERALAGQSGWTAVATDRAFPKGVSPEEIAGLAVQDRGQTRDKLRAILDGITAPDVFERFWDADGSRLFQQLRESFSRFTRNGHQAATKFQPPAVLAAAPAPAAPAAAPAPAVPAAPPAQTAPAVPAGPVPAGRASAGAPSRDQIFAELAHLYGEALEYPPEVFDIGTELEAELGVDSVKQTDLLGRVAKQYVLPAPSAGFRIIDYPTFGHVVDLVLAADRSNG